MSSSNLLSSSDLGVEGNDGRLESIDLGLATSVLGEALVPDGAVGVLRGLPPLLVGLGRFKKAAAAPRALVLGLTASAGAKLARLALNPGAEAVRSASNGVLDGAELLGCLESVSTGTATAAATNAAKRAM